MLAGEIAYQVFGVAIAWHVFELSHRALDLGLVGLVLFVPTLVLAIPAGLLTDHVDRRRITAASSIGEAICILACIAGVLGGVRALAFYLVVLFFIGIARAFGSPAERTLLPNLVDRAQYLSAQSTYASYRQITSIGGPALGGMLVVLGTTTAFALSVLMLIACALMLGTLPIRKTDERPNAPSLTEAFAGLRFVIDHPIIAGAISLDLFSVLFGSVTALLPVYAADVFHGGPLALGFMRSAPALGAVGVAVYLSRRPPQRQVGATLFFAITIFGAATIAFGISKIFLVSLVALAVIGGSDMVSVIIRNGLVQLTVPDSMRGRVTAFENIFIGASNELGAFESGTLAQWVGTVPSVVLGGIGTLAVIALWSAIFPSLRRADRIAT